MKVKIFYECSKCHYRLPKWVGKCPQCSEWNTMVETEGAKTKNSGGTKTIKKKSFHFDELTTSSDVRVPVGIKEFDRVLGGGLIAGSLILIGGEPGIGKSTLVLQACLKLSKKNKILYISGEESAGQTSSRYQRMGISAGDLYFINECSLENILAHVEEEKPSLIVIDSIQTIFSAKSTSSPGSPSQIRDVTFELMNFCKSYMISCFLIGHVTKEGNIAGPKLLEHMVDTVIYFEGENAHDYRILRSVKNRFGNVNEIGLFQMEESGLVEVEAPSECFLNEPLEKSFGRALTAIIEGSRVLIVEVQALVIEKYGEYSNGRRTAQGIDQNRLSLLIAVLEKYCDYQLQSCDIYVNVAGGLKLMSRESDLAILAAIMSSLKKVSLESKSLFLGEVGLTGEIRSVERPEMRLKEISQLSYDCVYLPGTTQKRLKKKPRVELRSLEKIDQLEQMLFNSYKFFLLNSSIDLV